MNFLPIAQRELRVAARKPMTYYSRSLAGLVAASIGVGLILAGFAGLMSAASAGQGVFYSLAIGAYFFATIEITLLTCDCISLEKRDGTLGFLFLTDLKGYDVIIGKLAPRLSRSLYGAAAILPALAFSFFLGGVSISDFAAVALTLANALFFAAFALLISTCTWREQRATTYAMIGFIVFTGILPALGFVFIGHPAAMLFLSLTPAGAFLAALGPAFSPIPGAAFGWSLLITQLLAWIFIIAASWLVPHSFHEEPEIKRKPRPAITPRQETATTQTEHDLLMRATLERSLSRGKIWFLTTLTLLIFLGASIIHPTNWFHPRTFVFVILTLHAVLKFTTASQACRALSRKRHSGELELILTTAFDESSILRGCLIVLKRQLLGPLIFVLLLDAIWLVVGWWQLGLSDGTPWAIAASVEIIWLLINLYSLVWLGLLFGLRSPSPTKAILRTLWFIIVSPWLATLLTIAALELLIPGAKMKITDLAGVTMAIGLPILIILANLGFTGWAINELRDRFRILASQEIPPREGGWNWRVIERLKTLFFRITE